MRPIDRLYQYMAEKNLSAHAFERRCGIANGYLGKQLKSKGTIGSEIVEKIHQRYTDLSLAWLITGEGSMLQPPAKDADSKNNGQLVEEETASYEVSSHRLINSLKEKVVWLEESIADKVRIIALLEAALKKNADSN